MAAQGFESTRPTPRVVIPPRLTYAEFAVFLTQAQRENRAHGFTRPGVLWQREAQLTGTDTSSSQPHQIYPLKAAARGFRGGGGIPTPRTGIGTVCPAFHPNCGGMSRKPTCSIKAQDKERWSQSDPSRPQSPAVRGFPRTPLRGRFRPSCGSQVVEKTKNPDTVRVCAVSHQRKRRNQYGTRE